MPEYIYDVALSFAGTEREYVRSVAEELKRQGRRVFFDEDEAVSLWGENLIERLDDVYRNQAQYVVIFVSRSYAESAWTRIERRSALTRAMNERRAYILPARFDDTELPGILPSVGYMSLSGVSGAELARRIVTKITNPSQHLMPPPAEPGWEWLMFADELERGVFGLAKKRHDFRIGFSEPTGEQEVDLLAVPSTIRTTANSARQWAGNLERILSTANQEAAFGLPGESGNGEAIKHLAGALTRLYEGFIDWGLRVRGIAVPPEASEVMWALSRFAEGPIGQYEAFVAEYARTVREVVAKIRANLPLEDSALEIKLTLDIPDPVIADYNKALKRFGRIAKKARRGRS